VLKQVVNVLEVVALVAAALVVVMLFANEPDTGGGGDTASADAVGAEVFSTSCAGCHGADAGGAIGPQLSGGAVVEAFPDEADQIVVVTEGRGGMPAFAGQLTPEEIAAVVAYTRTL
jgi:mono/diheme cytochrome c family protein